MKVWGATVGSESSVGLEADYSSNPLFNSPAEADEAGALVANVPITYNGEEQTIDLTPRVRFAASHGPAQLLSDYQYLDADWTFSGERNVLGANADWHHDSTLYNQFEQGAIHGHAIYRQEDIASLSWLRHFSERDDLQLAASWDRQQYAAAAHNALTSYAYGQGSLQYNHTFNERWQLTASVGAGAYDLLGQSYRSQQWFGQMGAKRVLGERWSVMLQGGYSYLRDHNLVQNVYCAVDAVYCYYGLYPWSAGEVRQGSSAGAPNGTFTLEHTFERATLDVAVSRAIQPSGLGALVTQDDVSLKDTVNWTERWTVAGALHASRVLDSFAHLSLGTRRYYDAQLSAVWQWTEHWTLQMQSDYTLNQYGTSRRPTAGLSLSLFRQFGRVRLD